MLFDRRLLIVTGKGGTGRSAVTAALSQASAERGLRTLSLAMGDPGGLALHLGVPSLNSKPRPVAHGLDAAAIDPAAALDEYVRVNFNAIPARLASRVFAALASSAPGVRDIIVMGKCVHEAAHHDRDLVVVDGYPTGQIESLLGAPATISDLVSRGPVHSQAVSLLTTLSDREFTGLVIMATPEELSLAEADSLIAHLPQLGLDSTIARLVINHWIAPPDFDAAPPEAGPVAEAAGLRLALVARQNSLLSYRSVSALLPVVFGAEGPRQVVRAMVEALQ